MPDTDPIKPTETKDNAAAKTDAAAKATDAKAKENKDNKNTSKAKAPARPKRALAIAKGPSPLQAQRQRPRSEPDPTAISITHLTGPYKGQKMSIGQWLGVWASEVNHQNSAQWQVREADHIRSGANFSRLGRRTFALSLQFYDEEHDITHLAENLATLTQIGEEEETPPLLLLRQGALVARPVFCSRIDTTYKEPFAGDKGYRVAELKLNFQLQAGKDSEHALGPPLVATPLTDWKLARSREERQRQGVQAVVGELLAPCLGEAGSAQVQQLLADDKLADVTALAQLEPNAFIQSAIAGMIPKTALESVQLQAKLQSDLASVLAQSEDGIGAVDGESPRRFAAAIQSGNFSGLSEQLQPQAQQAQGDYQILLKAIQEQKLGENAQVFNRTANPTAGERLRRLGSCGISLRQVGADKIAGSDSVKDRETLEKINQLLADPKTSDREIQARFGLESQSQVRALRNGVPYSAKGEFVHHAARQGDGVSGYVMWANFVANRPEEETKKNGGGKTEAEGKSDG